MQSPCPTRSSTAVLGACVRSEAQPQLPQRKVGHWRHLWASLAVCSSMLSTPLLAADNSAEAASALKLLLGAEATAPALVAPLPVQGYAPVTVQHNSPMPTNSVNGNRNGRVTVTVQRGETLDRLIRRTLPNLPLQTDFLRTVYVGLNPQVFPSGSPHLMRAGSTLQVPSMADLRQQLMQRPGAAALLGDDSSGASASDSASDKRHWVRFP